MILQPVPSGRVLACDTETTGLDLWHGDRPFAISFCNEEGETGLIRWAVNPYTREVRPEEKDVALLQHLFSDEKKTLVFWHREFDIRALELAGFEISCKTEEAYFAWHTINNDEIDYRLKNVALRRAKIPKDDEIELQRMTIRKRRLGRKLGWRLGASVQADYWLAGRECDRYATQDAFRTMVLWKFAKRQIENENLPSYEFEQSLWPVFHGMISRGLQLDRREARRQKLAFEGLAREELVAIWKIAGWRVKPEKKSDLILLLYNQLGFTPTKLTEKSGEPSTEWEVIKRIKHPVVEHIGRYRAARKAASTYFGRFIEAAVYDGARWIVHPELRQVGPATGRSACANPSLQNVPTEVVTRGPLPVEARGCFRPRDGCVWLSIDQEQVEPRVYADLVYRMTGDEELLNTIREGMDFHTYTANRVWGRSASRFQDSWRKANGKEISATEAMGHLEEFNWSIVDAELAIGVKTTRGLGKMRFFHKIYGGGISSAAEAMGVAYSEAALILEEFDTTFPAMGQTMEKMVALGWRQGYIDTAYGRRLRIPRGRDYVAVNWYVQGSSADLLKRGILGVYQFFEEEDITGWQLLPIHDEQLIELEMLDPPAWIVERIKTIMEDHGGVFYIETPVSVKLIRERWSEPEPWEQPQLPWKKPTNRRQPLRLHLPIRQLQKEKTRSPSTLGGGAKVYRVLSGDSLRPR